MFAKIDQRPVGQGGFTTGQVETDQGPLRWVYDCGSDDTRPLQDEIRLFLSEGGVDLLFISHLHADHVNGIDALLSEGDVVEVVLPYIGNDEKKLLLASGAARGVLSTSYRSFLSNPVAWLSRRRVKRVRFIRGDDPDDGLEGREGAPDFPSEQPSKHKWLRLGGPTSKTMERRRIPVTVDVGNHDAICPLSGGVGAWVFVPQVYQPSKARMDRFSASLEAVFGAKQTYRQLAKEALTQAGRAKLRLAYDQIWRDHNLVSMSLYAGPVDVSNLGSWTEVGEGHHRNRLRDNLIGGGWLLTGDAKLVGERRRNKFKDRYSAWFGNLDVFQLPHHGSRHSGDWRLFQALGGRPIGFAAASLTNKYRHPHDETFSDFRRALRSEPLQVSEDALSALISIYYTR
tara:strand:+ start:3253 stop:4452 length:1200 start_codon:yes stop_codon:yes gene_type:complete